MQLLWHISEFVQGCCEPELPALLPRELVVLAAPPPPVVPGIPSADLLLFLGATLLILLGDVIAVVVVVVLVVVINGKAVSASSPLLGRPPGGLVLCPFLVGVVLVFVSRGVSSVAVLAPVVVPVVVAATVGAVLTRRGLGGGRDFAVVTLLLHLTVRVKSNMY